MTTVEKLSDGRLPDARTGWIVTIAITLVAFGLRFVNFWYPKILVFDETYYPKDAYSLLKFGYERTWPKDANDRILAGDADIMLNDPSFTVHPPLGKWIIALGEQLFGMNSFGWRIMSVVFGSLLVMATIRLARRLSRSTLVGGIAGVLLTFDGLAFVMSRIGLLDIFQATFTVAAVACVVADRDYFRWKLASYLTGTGIPDLDGRFGPLVWWRPWRIAAGVLFGCAIAVKWNSIYVLAAFGILSVAWDVGARRLAGASRAAYKSVLIDAPLAFVKMVIVGLLAYVATWSGYLLTDGGYLRQWGAQHPDDPVVKVLGAPLGSLWRFHVETYKFHTGDYIRSQTHTYASNPLGWPLMLRTIGFDATNDIKAGEDGCTATGTTCLRVIQAMGTPLLWWLAAVALLIGAVLWLSGRDWRYSVPVLATLAVWLPWTPHSDRPIFFFYAVVMVPFTVTGLALVLGRVLGPADHPERRRRSILVGTLVGLVVLNFAFIYPVLTDELMTRTAWLLRMWLPSWI
ncbi:MAG: phospholipid carrier-dependent glycosyltransferase [Propionibacteriaceae bacterium]|nr:phospholipid carrier-dependent glycosyltransferase [Propionibacteriaceae bacterium]